MNTISRRIVCTVVAALILAGLLTGAVFAQDAPDALPETGAANLANQYITQLDELRMLGAASTSRSYLAHPQVYEFSSDLQRLNAAAADQGLWAYIHSAANAYVTTLDQLRNMR
ncbi:MAG: hypothetical protein BroJett021_10210 [Chloroflexota bacterium]|nr:hypothetical protein [Caldilinea sp.]GIK72033.1 MAG: hypothetical protein BroJett021_10210 [Chloroflexota bacterium]